MLPYRVRGHGPTVVLVHGAGEDRRAWGAQERALAGEFRVVTYSRRGHPPLRGAGGDYTYDQHVADLVALIRGLGAGPVFLVGHSYGAYLALRVVADHPELVRGAVLAEPPVPWLIADRPEYPAIERTRAAVFDSVRAALAVGDSVSALRLFVDWTNAAPATFATMTRAEQAQALANTGPLRRMLAAGGPPPISCERLGQVTRPVLLIEGARTNPYFHLGEAALLRCLPRAGHVTLAAASHHSIWQDSTGFNRALIGALRSASPRNEDAPH
jgi:pimeloyl-ACP methyl ester carboxylesterase